MDTSSTLTLTRLLNRLEHTLLSPAADARLRHSKYERARVAANVEHARSLLLTLDKQSAAIRVQAQKQQVQSDLAKKRDTIKRLSARLTELNQLGEDVVSDTSDEEEDLQDTHTNGQSRSARGELREFAPARPNVSSGISLGESNDTIEPDVPKHGTRQQDTNGQIGTQELRARKPLQSSDNRSAASTTAREQLFAGRKQHPDLETTEALMTHNREEQEVLSNGLLQLARSLKESSLNFASSLEAEKDVMKRAEGSLDKSASGMDQAEKKMGMLRRMSEGQGWWGRMKLYGFIAGLWLACFLLVFVGPKLRF